MVASPAATPGHPAPYAQQQQQQFSCLIFTDSAASAPVVRQVAGHQVHKGLCYNCRQRSQPLCHSAALHAA